ncbi:response regulator transcription factor [Niallia oryzisoli]|uniref:response regulator transcription factor n=1 Tax=Niallia oryzisoli TaxID=1737571 RepID=UPI00373548C7
MKILYAEDNNRLGMLTHSMLKNEFSHVDWVTDGIAAYDFASRMTYDLLILDWMMPKLDGVEVCLRLRKNGYHGAIIMLTSKDGLEDKRKGLDSGADGYLIKPIQFGELIKKILILSKTAK